MNGKWLVLALLRRAVAALLHRPLQVVLTVALLHCGDRSIDEDGAKPFELAVFIDVIMVFRRSTATIDYEPLPSSLTQYKWVDEVIISINEDIINHR